MKKTIRKSTIELLGDMGAAQMEHEILGQVKKLVQKNKQELEDQTGISSSLTIESAREYSEQVIMEIQGKKSLVDTKGEEKF